jgi:hypothetical protein
MRLSVRGEWLRMKLKGINIEGKSGREAAIRRICGSLCGITMIALERPSILDGAETKCIQVSESLYSTEVAKIDCGKKHFSAIDIDDYAKASPLGSRLRQYE